jgi:hypothetical protein
MGSTPINPGTAPPGQPGPLQPGEFHNISQWPLVSFATAHVPPPSPLYVQRDDRLIVNCLPSTPSGGLTIRGRLLQPDGHIQAFEVFRDQFGTAYLDLSEGFLLNITVSGGPSTGSRQTFCIVALCRGTLGAPVAHAILIAGYLTQTTLLGWPGGPIQSPLEGPGRVYRVIVADPAAGAEISITVPNFRRWRVQSLFATFTTSAVVGSRYCNWLVDDGASVVFRVNDTQAVAASGAAYLTLSPGWGAPAGGSGYHYIPLPNHLVLAAGHRIRTSTTYLDAGDQYSSICPLVEEWFELG